MSYYAYLTTIADVPSDQKTHMYTSHNYSQGKINNDNTEENDFCDHKPIKRVPSTEDNL